MSAQLKAAQANEQDAAQSVKGLQKRFDAKVAECESLLFRLKHMEDMSQMLDPPAAVTQSSIANIKMVVQSDTPHQEPANQLESFGDRMVAASPAQRAVSQTEIERLRLLEATNKKLEIELSLVKEALTKHQDDRFSVNIDHYSRIQELQNKVQIENKQLRVTNQKLETKLEAQHRQINHLEGRVTAVMVEKEEIIVKLKSEIVLLKADIEDSRRNFETKVTSENARFQKEFQMNFSGQEKKLRDEKDQVVREKTDLQSKINQLQNELEQMAADFSKYRADITRKDQEKEQSISELQQKLKGAGQLNESQTRQLQERIETFDNQIQVLAKQNSILALKLRLVRESVETLYRQKMFIVENIEKSSKDLARESAQVEANMMSENDNNEYLISVKKAVKISQTMVDMGLNAINNVSQIVAFLKIDEVRNLIAAQDSEQIIQAQENIVQSKVTKESQQQDIEKLNLLFQQEDIQQEGKQKAEPAKGLRIHQFISGNNITSAPKGESDSDKNEDHYYDNCPVELSSILSKVLADVLVLCGGVADPQQIPIELMKLVQLGSRKGDPAIEQDIYQGYLSNSKSIIEGKFVALTEENTSLKQRIEKLQQASIALSRQKQNDENKELGAGMSPTSAIKSRLKTLSKLSEQNQLQEVSNTQGVIAPKQDSLLNIKRDPSIQGSLLLLDDSQQKRRVSSIGSRVQSAKRSPMRQLLRSQDVAQLEQQIESLKIKIEEQKIKYKDTIMQLAQKVVVLEEQLDEKKLGQEQEMQELERLQNEELQKTKQGIQQREVELVNRSNEYKMRAEQAEEELKGIREQVTFLNAEIVRITTFQRDFDSHIVQKEKELRNYRENVQSYVNLKVSQRNIFGLTLEINSENERMINEAMLKYYFNKCLKLNKDKFRFLSTEEVQFQIERQVNKGAEEFEQPDEQVTVVKVLIEIVDDQENVDRYFKLLKNQIREGISILYDLQPLFLSINLGQCGIQLKDSTFIKDFHLIKRTGIIIKNEHYVASVLRHKTDPLSFKVISTSADLGEEYVLDLQQRDLFELTEGNHSMLEISEPSQLVDTIIDNLIIATNQQTGVKTLCCEHKVYFNQLFINKHVPNPEKQKQLSKFMSVEGNVLTDTQPSQDSLAFRNTSFRNNQILQHVQTQGQHVTNEFRKKLLKDTEVQTDSQSSSIQSLLGHSIFKAGSNGVHDEIFVTTYQGYQRVGKGLELKVKIDEGQRSGALVFTFEEIRTKDKSQICMLESHLRDRYIIHSECVKFTIGENEDHLMLLTFERFQEDGFLIKMHDMKYAASEEFFIVKKSNGQYARLTRPAGIEAIISNGKEHEELRNLIFDLTFTLTVPSQQILYANLAAVEQQMMAQEQNNEGAPNSDPFQLPIMKRQVLVQQSQKESLIKELLENSALTLQATARYQADPYSLPSGVLLQKHERGELLYRNIYTVRCCLEEQEVTEHQSLISFYVKKDGLISVEVFLFRESQKMSIASQVSSHELFGMDHMGLTYINKTQMLDQMMEKLYVLSEGGQYHLKVENDAVPMSEILEQRKNAPPPNPQPNPLQNNDGQSSNLESHKTPQTDGRTSQQITDEKLKEIDFNRKESLSSEKATLVKSYIQMNDILFEYKAYFLHKPHKEAPPVQISPSKKNKSQKKQLERSTSIANNFEDIVDFEYIFVEVTDKQDRHYQSLLTIKKLNHIMSSNPYEMQSNWGMIQSKDKEKLVEFLKKHTYIDPIKEIIKIESFQPSKELILQMFTNEVGGVFLRREDNQSRFDLEKEIVQKRLLMNQEVDMSEFSYDVKLFQVFSLLEKEKKALSYCFEIFCLNEPDLLYRYNYALHEQSSFIHSPIHIGYDLVNLIENPMSKSKEHEEPRRKSDFQTVLQKYIDNRLLLMTHEQIFPHQITFCLYESSSRLHWSYTFDPQQADQDFSETLAKTALTGRWNIEIGQLSILDQGTAERFIALMMSDILDKSKEAAAIQVEVREDSWAELGDTEAALRYDLVKNRFIEGDLCLNLSKIGVDCLKIEIKNSQFMVDSPGSPSVGSAGVKQGSPMQDGMEKLLKAQTMQPTIDEDLANSVKFIINASQRSKFLCKLIKLREQSANRLLALTCDLKKNEIDFKIIELTGVNERDIKHRVLYQYIFREKKAFSFLISVNHIIERKHLEEAIAEVCTSGQAGNVTSSLVSRASKFYDIISRKQKPQAALNIFQDNLSMTQKRLQAVVNVQTGNTNQQLILHRKSFFDDSHEKLIVVSVSINCSLTRKKGHGTAQLCVNEVDSFKLIINEPETKRKMEFDLKIEHCFLEEELLGGLDLRNINHLKKMARCLVEERAIIKRVVKDAGIIDEEQKKEQNNMYTVEINLQNAQLINPNSQTPMSESPAPGQVVQINTEGDHQQSLNKGVGSKSKNTNSIDNAASSSIKNAANIPEDEGGDEFEAMESAIAAGKVSNIKVSSGQTSLGSQGNQFNTNKSQSFRMAGPDILPPQNSVIEEEGSQEEYEDSPDVHARKDQQSPAALNIDEGQQNSPNDRYSLPRDDEYQEEGDNTNQNMDQVEDDPMQQSIDSQADLLYERDISESQVIQIMRASPRDPYSVFQVRQRSLIDGRLMQKFDIDQELLEVVISETNLPENAAEMMMPELFDALSEYIVNKVLMHQQ